MPDRNQYTSAQPVSTRAFNYPQNANELVKYYGAPNYSQSELMLLSLLKSIPQIQSDNANIGMTYFPDMNINWAGYRTKNDMELDRSGARDYNKFVSPAITLGKDRFDFNRIKNNHNFIDTGNKSADSANVLAHELGHYYLGENSSEQSAKIKADSLLNILTKMLSGK